MMPRVLSMESGLAESVNGGAAQAGHKVGHLGGQGLAVERPQQGGGGGRREGHARCGAGRRPGATPRGGW